MADGLTHLDAQGHAHMVDVAGKPVTHRTAVAQAFVEMKPTTLDLIVATAETDGKTGVEMEALTAASAAALTVYDMCKAVDRGMTITDVRLVSKEGGASGTWTREEASE